MSLNFNFKRPPSLPDGTHQARISKIADVQRKAYQSEELEDQIEFNYRVDTESDEPMIYRRYYRPSLSDKSRLIKDLKIILGAKAVDQAKGSDSAMSSLILGCLNMDCLIVTETNEKGYSNITAVMPVPKSAFQKDKPKSGKTIAVDPLSLEPESMKKARDEADDDDIPF
jgi:hypothetical protein